MVSMSLFFNSSTAWIWERWFDAIRISTEYLQVIEVLYVVAFVGFQDQMWLPRGQIKDHLCEVGIGPREPGSGVVGRIVDVLSLVDQTKSCGVLSWYVCRLFQTTKGSDLRLR